MSRDIWCGFRDGWRKQIKLLAVLALLYGSTIGVMIWTGCRRRAPAETTSAVVQLATDEKAKIVVQGRSVASVVKGLAGTVTATSQYVPPEGKITVVVKDDGQVVVKAKTTGFCLHPGVGAALLDGHVVPTLDVKWFYSGRFGLLAAEPLHRIYWTAPCICASWQVYSGSAVWVGYSARKQWLLGIRVSF